MPITKKLKKNKIGISESLVSTIRTSHKNNEKLTLQSKKDNINKEIDNKEILWVDKYSNYGRPRDFGWFFFDFGRKLFGLATRQEPMGHQWCRRWWWCIG